MFNFRLAFVLISLFVDVSNAFSATKSTGNDSFVSTSWVPFSGISGAKEKALETAKSKCDSLGKKVFVNNLSGSECGLRGGCGKARISYLCLGRDDLRFVPRDQQKMRDSKDDARCKSFGAKIGTDAYVNCRLKQQEIQTKSEGNSGGTPAPEATTRTICIEIPMGNIVTTQCRQVTN